MLDFHHLQMHAFCSDAVYWTANSSVSLHVAVSMLSIAASACERAAHACQLVYTCAFHMLHTFAGGCKEYRGRAYTHAKVRQQPGSLLCCAAGPSPHAHATPHPH